MPIPRFPVSLYIYHLFFTVSYFTVTARLQWRTGMKNWVTVDRLTSVYESFSADIARCFSHHSHTVLHSGARLRYDIGNAMITQELKDPYDSTWLVGRVSHISAQVNRAMLQVSDLKRTWLTGTCQEKQQNWKQTELLLHFYNLQTVAKCSWLVKSVCNVKHVIFRMWACDWF